ncbi:MAG: hypothetical protein K6C30_01705 [Bacteroidaceae bacterium]|nr:hypothetical protein [Bacteroidaceae bacterium]
MKTFLEYFKNLQERNGNVGCIHSCPELIACIQQTGFLPLLESGIQGFAAESIMAEECRFTQFPDGSWEWPLWQWKGSVVRDGDCLYGKFFSGKAGFVSREWWPDFLNWRRSHHPAPAEGTIEDIILSTLREHGSMITRELRAACDFTGKNMRSKFDAYINRLQMSTYIVTEDFVYPTDKHGREYGFGWSLLTTPERLLASHHAPSPRSPEESFQRMADHLSQLLPAATEKQIRKLLQ